MRQFKRGLSVVLVLILCLSVGFTAAATETEELTPEQQAEIAELDRMCALPIQTNEIAGWPQGPTTCNEAAIVMEADTGAILYAKNIDDHHYPASITKTLTTLTALKNGQLTDNVSFSADSLSFLEPGDAYIGMKEGNVITLEQALYAVLLASANEVSYAVGESVGKNAGHDYNWFLEQMNATCQELGGMNSHFANTNGLHDDNHYTCARDMALIGSELFKYPEVFKIMQTLEYKIEASDTTQEHVFQQNHKMLYPQNANYYEYAVGGKTGYTDQARTTLVTMADNGQLKLVCVVLKSRGSKVYVDMRALCDYCFSNFTKISAAEEEKSEDVGEILTQEGNSSVVVPAQVSFEDLKMELTPDESMGGEATLTYTYEGTPVGTVRAKLSKTYLKEHSIKVKKAEDTKENGKKNAREKRSMSRTEKIILAAAIVLLIILIAALVKLLINRKRRSKRRKHRDSRQSHGSL